MNLLKSGCGANGIKNVSAAIELANILGHLPLALAISAAFMRRCDLICEEYLDLLRRVTRLYSCKNPM